MRKFLDHFSACTIVRWYRFQNSPTVRDVGLKFGMVIVFGRLEDHMHVFLPGSVHKLRHSTKNTKKNKEHHLCMFSGDIIFTSTLFYFKLSSEHRSFHILYFSNFLWNDVLCGHSLGGSHACVPPVLQILLPYQISSHYL
jgi:hypothetical protein